MNSPCANFVISFFADSEGRIGPASGTPTVCLQTPVLACLGPSWRQLARMAEKRVCMKIHQFLFRTKYSFTVN